MNRRRSRTRPGTDAPDAREFDARAFVENCYLRLLGRPADQEGLDLFVSMLASGVEPAEIVMSLATSAEYKQRILMAASPRRRFPERFRLAVETTGTAAHWVFDVDDPADFDWLEKLIGDDGYYEHEGVWSLEPDDDKRVMGELIASLGAKRALEIGCAAGAVLGVLAGLGVDADGVEISRMAYDHAPPAVQAHIHVGDLLELDLPSDYDIVFGLDVFEHLNPNRLAEYLKAITRPAVVPGGLVVANIPAFGEDEVFGEVFPVYLAEWNDDIAADRPFRVLHCDDDGYPMHGHLIWAHTDWWVAQFAAAGFVRQPERRTRVAGALRRPFRHRSGTQVDVRVPGGFGRGGSYGIDPVGHTVRMSLERDERPWGSYEVLVDAPDHKVKSIVVKPGKRLSYQKHARRSEHWFIVRGSGTVTLNDNPVPVAPGTAVDIELGASHRIENTGGVDLVFVEVQHGDYFGEDDIVRLEDDFGRAGA